MIDALISLDRQLFALINLAWTHPWLDTLMPIITNSKIWMPFILSAWLWLLLGMKGKKRGLALVLLLGVGLTDVVNSRVLKKAFGRKRPCVAEPAFWAPMGIKTSKSFPSSHAANTGAFAGIILFEEGLLWGAPFLILALAVAYSRVYVGVHYPLDVSVGLLVGMAIAGTAVWVHRRYWPPETGEPQSIRHLPETEQSVSAEAVDASSPQDAQRETPTDANAS